MSATKVGVKFLGRRYDAKTDTWVHNDGSGRLVTGMDKEINYNKRLENNYGFKRK